MKWLEAAIGLWACQGERILSQLEMKEDNMADMRKAGLLPMRRTKTNF